MLTDEKTKQNKNKSSGRMGGRRNPKSTTKRQNQKRKHGQIILIIPILSSDGRCGKGDRIGTTFRGLLISCLPPSLPKTPSRGQSSNHSPNPTILFVSFSGLGSDLSQMHYVFIYSFIYLFHEAIYFLV